MNFSDEHREPIERREQPTPPPVPVYEASFERVRDTSVPAVHQAFDVEEEEGTVHLRRLLQVVRNHKKKIAAFVLASVAIAGAVTKLITPLYEATCKINVERRSNGFIGQQASAATGYTDLDQVMTTQVELIKSDPVLRPATEKYHLLDLEHQFRGLTPQEAKRLEAAPIKLKKLKVQRMENTYLIKISYQAPDPAVAAGAANMVAASYLEHAFDSRDRSYLQVSQAIDRQLKDLEKKMNASGEALVQFNRKLNVIDPDQRISILSSRLLQLNSDFTSAQSERLKKEAILDETKSGRLAAAQVSAHADTLERLMADLNAARQDFAVVRTTYGENHPEYKKTKNRLDELERQFKDMRDNTLERVQVDYNQARAREEMARGLVAETRQEVDQLNSSAFSYMQLKSQSDSYKRLYEDLQRVTREEDINRSFQDAVIQIEEPARAAAEQTFPILWMNLLIAFLVSTLGGIAATILYDTLDTKLRGPEQANRLLKVDVVASLPRNKRLTAIPGPARPRRVVGKMPHTQRSKFLMLYQESIRALRINLDLMQGDQPWRSLLVTSSTEDEGKAAIAANLAFSYALTGKKVLLIDADMRRPSLDAIFEKKVVHGLAELLEEKADWGSALLKVAREHLYLVPAGKMNDRTADYVRPGITKMIEVARDEFDLIILNGPPLLSAPEAAQLAAITDSVIVTARAGISTARQVAAAYSLLSRAQAHVAGLVLDEVQGGGVIAYGDPALPVPLKRVS